MLPMLRGTFFSIGMFITLWGVSLLFVDKLVLNMPEDVAARTPGFRGMYQGNTQQPKQRVIDPPDWAAFSLLSVGAVTMLYAVALPKKQWRSVRSRNRQRGRPRHPHFEARESKPPRLPLDELSGITHAASFVPHDDCRRASRNGVDSQRIRGLCRSGSGFRHSLTHHPA